MGHDASKFALPPNPSYSMALEKKEEANRVRMTPATKTMANKP
jgi:hypothetical protein